MLKSVVAKDYMAANLVTLKPDMDVLRAIHMLVENSISGAPVVGEHGDLVGILTEKDCMRVALNAGYYGEVGGKVSEFMTREVVTVEAEMSILDIAKMFLEKDPRRYPVVEDNRLVGQISRRDVLRALEVLW